MNRLLFRLRAPLLVLVTSLACVALHEAGHALAGWATGARVAQFDVLSLRPHVLLVGPATPAAQAVRALAGSGLVMALWFAAMLILPHRTKATRVLETVSFFAGVELLGWLLSALVHPWQRQRNDAGAFLALSGLQPWVAVLACVLLATLGVWLFSNRLPGTARSASVLAPFSRSSRSR